jgi:hypothetical protein
MYRVSIQRRLLSFVAMVLVQTLVQTQAFAEGCPTAKAERSIATCAVLLAGHTLAEDSAWQHAEDRGLIARDAIRSQAEKRRHEPRIYFRPFCRRSRYVTSRFAPCWE